MTRLLQLIISVILVIFTSAINKVFGYIGLSTYLYVVPIIILIFIPIRTRYNTNIVLLIATYIGIVLYSILFTLFETEIRLDLNLIRIILISILVLKYSQHYSYERVFKLALIVNLAFLYCCFAFSFDYLAIEKNVDPKYVTRFGGFGINPNVEGYIIVLLYMGIALVNKKNTFQYLPFVLAGLILTFSYTSILAIVFFLVIQKRRKIIAHIIPFLFVVYLLVGFVDLGFLFGHTNLEKVSYLIRFLETGQGLNSLTTNRLELFSLGLQHLFSEPFTGHGLGYGANEIYLNSDVGVHNSYLEVLIDHGFLLGGIILILFSYLIPAQIFIPVFIMASAGHGFFYDVNFLTIIILTITYETFSKRTVSKRGLLVIERQ